MQDTINKALDTLGTLRDQLDEIERLQSEDSDAGNQDKIDDAKVAWERLNDDIEGLVP